MVRDVTDGATKRRTPVWLALAAVAVVAVVSAIVLNLYFGARPGATATPSPASPSPSVSGAPFTPPASPTPSPTAKASSAKPTPAAPTASAAPTPGTRPTIVRTNTKSTGEYRTSSVAIASSTQKGTLNPFVVKVETSVDVDPDDAARQMAATLNDQRSWIKAGRNRFAAVSDATSAKLVIYLASPGTVDKLCAPLDTEGTWSCRVGNRVILNSDRWLHMTPTYDDLAVYRSYMVNHEVGHYLGLGHVGCPKKGAKAPVMMQQSISLGGCVPEAWPYPGS